MGIKKVFRSLGQRIRLHVLNCEQHTDAKTMQEFDELHELYDVHYFREHPLEIYRDLRSSKYIPYSSIFIIINSECKCRIRMLHQTLKLIKSNKYLRYKTKLINSYYTLADYYRSNPQLEVTDKMLTKYARTTFLYPPILSGSTDAPHVDNITHDDDLVLMEHNIFLAADMENTLFMQGFVASSFHVPYQIQILLMDAYYKALESMNAMFADPDLFFENFLVESSTNADIYFYTINPALAIIINNYYFTSHGGDRKGSERDVQRLIRELNVSATPYILIQDCSRAELLQILEYIKRKDFSLLKSFLFFLMSHGDADNIIYTEDGQLDIREDILKSIQSNETLKDAEKTIVANACRGKIDMEWADSSDLERIQPTDAESLDDNTVLFYSVPNGILSPRDIKFGSPFIISFCQNFRNIDHTQDIRAIEEKIEGDLKKVDYYEDLRKRFELVIGNASKRHCIIQTPVKARGMFQLIVSIIADFPVLGEQESNTDDGDMPRDGEYYSKTLFYICGSLRKMEKFKEKYFTHELSRDHCNIDEEDIDTVF